MGATACEVPNWAAHYHITTAEEGYEGQLPKEGPNEEQWTEAINRPFQSFLPTRRMLAYRLLRARQTGSATAVSTEQVHFNRSKELPL